MSLSHVGTYTLPNVYFEKILVTTNATQVGGLWNSPAVTTTNYSIDLCIIDYFDDTRSVFFNHEIFKNFMEINVTIIQNKETIKQINSGLSLIPDSQCVKYKLQQITNFEVHPIKNDMAIYKFNANIPVLGAIGDDVCVYAFTSMNIDDMERQLNLDLDFADNKFMRGPLSSEYVLSSGQRPQYTFTFHDINDGTQWAGPVYESVINGEVQYKGGPFSKANSPALERRTSQNTKVLIASPMPMVDEADSPTLLNTDLGITLGTTAPTGLPAGALLTNPNLSLAERLIDINRIIE